MKTLITGTAMLVCLSAVMTFAINATTTPSFTPTVGQVATYTPVSVDVGNAASAVITLPATTITARHAPRVNPALGCSFAARELVQGSGAVRGFCP